MLVDDHNLIRETCSYLLNLEANFSVVAATGDPKEALESAKNNRPDIILLDINMPVVSGFDMIAQLLEQSPLSKIIGLSAHTQPVYVKKMIKLGARGYLTKNSSIEEITQAITEVKEGKIFLCREVKDILTEQAFNNEASPAPGIQSLTARQIEIMGLLNKALSSKEIAGELCISVKTVEVHRHQILRKLKMKNTLSAVTYFNSCII